MMSNARPDRFAPKAAFFVVAIALVLGGCATSTFDMLPHKAGGLPEDAPARLAEPLPTPNVYEERPTREAAPLDAAEQKKLETDLKTLRDSQRRRAGSMPEDTKQVAAKKADAKPAPKKGASKAAKAKTADPSAPPPLKLGDPKGDPK